MAEKEVKTFSSKLNDFMTKNRKALIAVICVIFVALIAFICVVLCNSKITAKNLNEIDIISFELTDGSNALEDEEVNQRKAVAMEKLAPYTKKGGVSGVRANMLAGEIAYQSKNYQDAVTYWNAAASKSDKSYTKPLALFNAAVCYEELNDLDSAAANYKLAADNKDFMLKNHAKFSYARVIETQGNIADAVTAYNELIDAYPDDDWAKLAKTRILFLQTTGKTE